MMELTWLQLISRSFDAERDTADGREKVFQDFNYFEDFLKDENSGQILRECRRNKDRPLKAFGWSYVEKHRPAEWSSRHFHDSEEMIDSWPARKGAVKPEQIKTLFTRLGLKVIKAEKVPGTKEEIFQLEAEPSPRGLPDYRHPIGIFGTQLKNPVSVVLLYGNHTEKELVDTITNLNLGIMPIVLLDRALDADNRRTIGEIFRIHTSRQNPFLLIDQVLFIYLAMHQETERLPALLKCALPYTVYQPFVHDGSSTADEMFCGRTRELTELADISGPCVVYGGRQLGKTALLLRVENRCSKPKEKKFAVYISITKMASEAEVTAAIIDETRKKTDRQISMKPCGTLKEMCGQLSEMFRLGKIISMHLLIDEADTFLASISDDGYSMLEPLDILRRETNNSFKFVLAGLHNVYRAKNATEDNGIFGRLGTSLCIKPLSPVEAQELLLRPLNYLGFKINDDSHMETILTSTNYYPGIVQFFGYKLVEALANDYEKYYLAAKPPFTISREQLGAIMNSSDLNRSIKGKFRLSLELDQRYFMIARCITLLYLLHQDRTWHGFKVDEILKIASECGIHCLENETPESCTSLLDEMQSMGILSQPEEGFYRLRRSAFVDIIGRDIDALMNDIANNNTEA